MPYQLSQEEQDTIKSGATWVCGGSRITGGAVGSMIQSGGKVSLSIGSAKQKHVHTLKVAVADNAKTNLEAKPQ